MTVASSWMPGPMVELINMPLTYLPLAADGLAFSTELMTVMALSTSFCGSNESLPTGTCTSAVLSVRNSTLPALISRMAETTSVVTVPVLGLGIRPLGPSTLPRRPKDFIMSGVAIRASKAVQPSFWIFSTMSSPPANSAPAASASAILSPEVIAAVTFTELAASELIIRVREFVGELNAGRIPAELRVALPNGLADRHRRNLAVASETIDEITCSTIHGFCQGLIKPYPVEANIDPGA